MTLKWTFSKMSFRFRRRDTELRFVTKSGKNRPLGSSRKVAWFTKQKNSGSAGIVPAPILTKMGRSRPKFRERYHPLTCSRIPNLVRIGCVLPDLFRKDWFFGPKSQYNIGFQPTTSSSAVAKRPRDASFLSVVSFNSKKKRRTESFIVSYIRYRLITACNKMLFCCLWRITLKLLAINISPSFHAINKHRRLLPAKCHNNQPRRVDNTWPVVALTARTEAR